jgi:hypothetical protein
MSGTRLVAGFLVFLAIFAAALIYFQFFAYYERIRGVETLTIAGEAVPIEDYVGIDAASSPLKLRGCFRIDPALVAGLPEAGSATPLTPPPWFRCFDARSLSDDLASGAAHAFRIGRETPEGFDLLIAVYPDGRGFLWRQLATRFAA